MKDLPKCVALCVLRDTFVRQGELRKAEWNEIDFDKSLWCIGAERMKMRSDHIVPLSRQSLEILREIRSSRVTIVMYSLTQDRRNFQSMKMLYVLLFEL